MLACHLIATFLSCITKLLNISMLCQGSPNNCGLKLHFCYLRHLSKMEKVQFRALCFVYSDFKESYSGLRSKASRPLMYVQRLRSIGMEVMRTWVQLYGYS